MAALQAYADRFNLMHFDSWFARGVVPACVQARPCRIAITHTAAHHSGTYFLCTLNTLGAYRCDSHARGTPGRPCPRTAASLRLRACLGDNHSERDHSASGGPTAATYSNSSWTAPSPVARRRQCARLLQ
jgi:hypothetical protein